MQTEHTEGVLFCFILTLFNIEHIHDNNKKQKQNTFNEV